MTGGHGNILGSPVCGLEKTDIAGVVWILSHSSPCYEGASSSAGRMCVYPPRGYVIEIEAGYV